MSAVPVQKRTSVQVVPIQGRYEVIALPHGMLMFDDVEDIVPTFSLPSFDVLVSQVSVDVGQAAGAALFAG